MYEITKVGQCQRCIHLEGLPTQDTKITMKRKIFIIYRKYVTWTLTWFCNLFPVQRKLNLSCGVCVCVCVCVRDNKHILPRSSISENVHQWLQSCKLSLILKSHPSFQLIYHIQFQFLGQQLWVLAPWQL